MAFIQGVSLGGFDTRDKQHGLTNFIKKGRTVVKVATNVTTGALDLASPVLDIFIATGTLSSTSGTQENIKKGITLACTVIKTPKLAEKALKEVIDTPKTEKGIPLAERIVNVASDVTAVAIGILSCFKLGDTTVSLLAVLSTSIGNGFTVVGTFVSDTLAFTGVFSTFSLIKGVLDVGKEGFKLYKTAQKINAAKEKIQFWENMEWTEDSVSQKLEHLKDKRIKVLKDLDKLEGAVKNTSQIFDAQRFEVDKQWENLNTRKLELEGRNVAVRLFYQIVPQIKLTFALLKKEDAEKSQKKALKAFDNVLKSHSITTIKIRNFKVIKGKILKQTLQPFEMRKLKAFQNKKVSKWGIKKSNLKAKALRGGVKIGLKILIVISVIASMALTFSGVGTMPGIVTGASMTLFTMAAEYGLKKFKEHNPDQKWKPVKVPLFVIDEKAEPDVI